MKIVQVSTLVVMPLYWLCLCNHVCVVSGQCLDDQKSSLLQFKNNITFTPGSSSKLKSWNESDDCCKWMGVTCDIEGHVTILDLTEESIFGQFDDSSALFGLQYLKAFSARLTNLTGAIPHSIGNMRHLSYLDLSYCGFNGTIPNSLSNLTELIFLDLSFNNFTGPMISFGLAKNLTNLDLSRNDLSGIIPSSHFEGLHDLTNIDLSYNSFTGSIPSSLFTPPSLESLSLSHNEFSQLDEFINVTSFALKELDISYNNLSRPIPMSFFQLNLLTFLSLSSNNFIDGPLPPELRPVNVTNDDMSFLPKILILELASCNLKTFPSFLQNCVRLSNLDLSANQIQGPVPNWIWDLYLLENLNISHNLLTGLERPPQDLTESLSVIDLHYNKLEGPIPTFPKRAKYLDFSSNKFSSVIPRDIGDYMSNTYYLSLSNNSLHGTIPYSLCNASLLQFLDLSINHISGTIPSCLMMMSHNLKRLNLKNNNLSSCIPHRISASCGLWTLNLHGNLLDGPIPQTLVYCSNLQVLDLGSNQITGGFPCFLNEISTLHVLVLRNNKFQGSLTCSKANNKTWEMLQIVDIAFNNFSGKLPGKYFSTWKRYIMHDQDESVSKDILQLDGKEYYQDSVTVFSKGQQMELIRILLIFTAIDFSSNHFEGPIPDELMDFRLLYSLNMSNNALSGKIASSIGNLKQLESLDLSKNSLSGEIPMQLASLSFLAYLNLSFNHLVGKIPTSTQLQSFSASSFEGNDGLYGPPLTQNPPGGKEREVPPQQECERLACTIDWNFISVELGLVFGHGLVYGPILIWKRWRIRYWQLVHKILCWIFPQLYLEYVTRRGQTYTTLRWMHS